MDTKWYEYKPKEENRLIGHWHATLPKHDPALVIDHSMDNRSTDTCLKEAFQSIHWFFRVSPFAISFSICFEYISLNPRLFCGHKANDISCGLIDSVICLNSVGVFFPQLLVETTCPSRRPKVTWVMSRRPKMFAANSSLGEWESPIWFVGNSSPSWHW